MSEKLHKVLARAGLGSRREMERWIEAGRVSVDGRPARLGDRVLPDQKICVDGRSITMTGAGRARVLVYHKPEGQLCTRSDPQGRPTVFDKLPAPKGGRWITVGRLDLNSSGLLLFSTDGELAAALMHPRNQILREYSVRVFGSISPADLQRLRHGVKLDDGLARFDTVEPCAGRGANQWYRVSLREGRKREVRRMFEVVGGQVSRLIRVRFGPVSLPRSLPPGRWSELNPTQVRELQRVVPG